MNKRRAAKSVEDAPLPDYIPRAKTVSLGLGPEDRVWIGDDGTLDPDALLREHGWHPESSLEAVLRAIIEANQGPEGVSENARLEIALEALVGTARKRGMDELDDYDLLCAIARRYWAEWCAGNKTPRVIPIAWSVLSTLPATDPRVRRASSGSRERRLADKFKTNRNLLLARVTLEDDWNSRDTQKVLDRVIQDLRWLGVAATGQRLRRTEPKPE